MIAADNLNDRIHIEEAILQSGHPIFYRFVHDIIELLGYLGIEGNRKPSSMLIDLRISSMDAKVVAAIKKNPELAKTPVLVYVDDHSEEEYRKVYENIAIAFIPKPTSAQDWLESIELIYSYCSND